MPEVPVNYYAVIGAVVGSMVVGFLDATYLTVLHYADAPPQCGFFIGCEAVTSSRYATIVDVPIALIGSLYYLFWILAAISHLDSGSPFFPKIRFLTLSGFFVSLALVLLQIFALRAICIYCIISAASSTALLFLALAMRPRDGKQG